MQRSFRLLNCSDGESKIKTMKDVVASMPSWRSHRVADIRAFNGHYLKYFSDITIFESQRKLVRLSKNPTPSGHAKWPRQWPRQMRKL